MTNMAFKLVELCRDNAEWTEEQIKEAQEKIAKNSANLLSSEKAGTLKQRLSLINCD